ncbi:hypothetical protein S7335_2329 [Synechococcus sp. PCC 7335]|nr:hypothetical protein [Synechococcus sp. PCC 7335]EDX84632.1 hypothetical protein S7335_2329 [Synechococcus sp. PCC 7335]
MESKWNSLATIGDRDESACIDDLAASGSGDEAVTLTAEHICKAF